MSTHLILGGARSGKSGYAEKLAAESGLEVCYIATAQIYDDEFDQRIQLHKARRPSHWQTQEEPFRLAEALQTAGAANRCLLIDCLTLWLAQCICPDCQAPVDVEWSRQRDSFLEILPAIPGKIILVSNEVGMGIVPMGEINRQFQDEAGRLNQAVAAICDEVVFVAAGLPLKLK